MRDYDRWERNWQRMEAMARRGFRGMNLNFGKMGEWSDGIGGNFRIGRMLASGDLRLVALYLIEQQPRHGYDLIKAIEEKSAGFYSPSPGIVYPALTFLEEAGFVTSAVDGNKKLYTITDEGRSHLADNREAIESTLSFLGKAGERMKEWRERMTEAAWPFAREAQDEFGSERGPGWHEPHEAHVPPHERGHHPHPHHPPHHQRPDRDLADVRPEVNEARKALKKAIKEAIGRGDAEQARVAHILRRAADEIRAGADDEVDI